MKVALSHLAEKLSTCDGFAKDDLNRLALQKSRSAVFLPGMMLNEAGANGQQTYLIGQGWAVCHRDLQNGNRQIVNFLLPGDFACLNVQKFASTSVSVTAITEVKAVAFTSDALSTLISSAPEIARIVLWITAQEQSVIGEHLTNIGRRTAYERTAHLLLELWCRLQRVGLATGRGYEVPLTLALFADALGITPIHVSRTLQRLRDDKLFDVGFASHRHVRILNKAEAVKAAQFDCDYLQYGDILASLQGNSRDGEV